MAVLKRKLNGKYTNQRSVAIAEITNAIARLNLTANSWGLKLRTLKANGFLAKCEVLSFKFVSNSFYCFDVLVS